MTRTASVAAVLLLAAIGFATPSFAAIPSDRGAAAEDEPAGKTNQRAWPMTISMGYGSDKRCALGGCEEAIADGTVTKTRARPTTTSMGYGSDQRCALDGCIDGPPSDTTVTRSRARATILAMGAGSDRRCALADQPGVCNG